MRFTLFLSGESITYVEKSNTMTVSVSFNGNEVVDRLTSNAGKIINHIQVAGSGLEVEGSRSTLPRPTLGD